MFGRLIASELAALAALAAFVATAGAEEYAYFSRGEGRVQVSEADGRSRPITRREVDLLVRSACLRAMPYGVAATLVLALPAAAWGQGTQGWARPLAGLAGLAAGGLTGAALSLTAGLWARGASPPYLWPAVASGVVLAGAAGAFWPRVEEKSQITDHR